MQSAGPILVCFAVKEEASHFRRLAPAHASCEWLLTGIGRRNAEDSIRSALLPRRPHLVISSGFAGGLNPKLDVGAVVFEAEMDLALSPALLAVGAHQVRFHCAARIVAAASDKLKLWQATGADAVEMESAIIREICREQAIPSATIRIVSDAAHEDLPLDFNQLMARDLRLNYFALVWTLARAPAKVLELLSFRRRIDDLGRKLAGALGTALEASRTVK